MKIDLKQCIRTVYQLADIIDKLDLGVSVFRKQSELGESEKRASTRDAIQMEMLQFAVSIVGSDGKIMQSEIDFLNDYLQLNIVLNADIIHTLLKDRNIEEGEISSSVSWGIAIFRNADAGLREKKYLQDNTDNIGDFLFSIYELLGKEIMVSDSKITEKEIAIYTKYMNVFRKTLKSDEYIYINSLEPELKDNDSSKISESDETVDELINKLNSLIGLDSVKQDVESLINLIQIRRIREKRGVPQPPMSLHLVFSGNPGTGKTTVARLISKIYYKIGVLSKGQFVEVDRSGLVGGYVGQTAIKVKEVVDSAIGGVLFIDEAYSLSSNKDNNDYGKEAIDTLLKLMEDNRDDLIVIVAGYTDLMEEFLESNPGLKSRFNKYIYFEDYTPKELFDIYQKMCNDSKFTIDGEAKSFVKDFFKNRYENRTENFANARDVRNFFEKTITNQANRLAKDSNISDKELFEIVLEDVQSIKLKD